VCPGLSVLGTVELVDQGLDHADGALGVTLLVIVDKRGNGERRGRRQKVLSRRSERQRLIRAKKTGKRDDRNFVRNGPWRE
jgi:hypothetical protein